MNKTSLTMMALVACEGAVAQSIQISGNADVAVVRSTGSLGNATSMGAGEMVGPRFGFAGAEDLGGGLKAGFFLEGTVNWDDGTSPGSNTNNQASGATQGNGLTFFRRASTSVGGSWGELRLGRDFSPGYWNLTFDPFLARGIGAAQTIASSVSSNLPAGQRVSNTVQYLYNHPFNAMATNGGQGFHSALMYFFGENPGNVPNSRDSTGYAGRLGYNEGALSVAVGYARVNYLSGNAVQRNIAGTYLLGSTKLFAHYASDSLGTVRGSGWLLGASHDFGSHTLRASWSRYASDRGEQPASAKIALGYVYHLSKRSALYTTFARVGNDGGASLSLGKSRTAANEPSSAIAVGMKHSF